VVYHACNGVWGVVLDYNPPLASRKPLLLLFWVSGLGLTIYGYFGIQPLLGGG